MCGIAGMVASSNVAKRLYRSIAALEYRGYDSCGMALQTNGHIDVRKDVGTVESVNRMARLTEMKGRVGIAHTRWATHGAVTKENAHPHVDGAGRVAVVHNGIVSNYRELREELEESGAVFTSDTDTEVIAHLLGSYLDKYGDEVERAFTSTLQDVEGTFSLAVISTNSPGKIYCAKQESPLIIGLGDSANFIGSDFNAFIEFTRHRG